MNTNPNQPSNNIFFPSDFNEGFPEDINPRHEEAATTIQAVVRSLLAQKHYREMKTQNFVETFRKKVVRLFKHIGKISHKVEQSWRQSLISQKTEIATHDRLVEIKKNVLEIFQDIRDRDTVNYSSQEDVEDFCYDLTDQYEMCREQLVDTCQDVGFQSLKKTMEYIFGEDWKRGFSLSAAKRIENLNMMFETTEYSCFVESGDSDANQMVHLYNAEGDLIVASQSRFLRGMPFLTAMRHFKEISGKDITHGAELNIPVEDEYGVKRVLVIKGHFKEDPINLFQTLGFVRSKVRAVKREMKDIDGIPKPFLKNYSDQYSLRDYLIKPTLTILQELKDDYQMLKSIDNGLSPFFVISFLRYPIQKQIRLFSLLLMQKDLAPALYLHETAISRIPEYEMMLRNSLHFSAQRKLTFALKDFEQTVEDLKSASVSEAPYTTRIALSNMDQSSKDKAMEKLGSMSGHEASKSKKYLDGLLKVPFGNYIQEPVSSDSSPEKIQDYLNSVKKALNDAVHGQDKAKEAVLEWLAQRISNGDSKGECIALEGPPGVGKTTFALQGLAKVLGRPFAFISLGGMTDASFLIGHGFTYVGSNWGRIVEILQESGCMNPIIYIDEADKISQTPKGEEIMGVLTRLLDFSQNDKFQDRYFSGVKFDLSQALFILSYNERKKINYIARDRLKVITVDPLSLKDKIEIAKKHLMPVILTSCGFESDDVYIEDEDLRFLIENYTWEAGARKLKENLFAIVRQINLQRLMEPDTIMLPYKVDRDAIIKFRDEPKIEYKKIPPAPVIGTVNGLYATSSGVGGITIVQAYPTLANKRLQLTLTGSQGNVMQESMSVARSVAWNVIPKSIKESIYKSPPEGMHIHCPEGATPKDGPSAGGAITTAIISQLLGVPIKNTVAMTGEIDLLGRITTIGGLTAKLHGAKKAGVKLALIPRGNEKDLQKIQEKFPELFGDTFRVKIVDTIYDVLDHALVNNPIVRPEKYVFSNNGLPEEDAGFVVPFQNDRTGMNLERPLKKRRVEID